MRLISICKLSALAVIAFVLGTSFFEREHNIARADAAGGQAIVDAGSLDALPAVPVIASGSGSAQIGSGSAVGSGSATPLPSDGLHDPTKEPAATLSDLESAKKIGWSALVFAVLTILARLVGAWGKSVSWLGWLNTGKTAVVVGFIGATAAAMFNALASGGSLLAAAVPSLLAGLAWWDSNSKQPPVAVTNATPAAPAK